MGQEKEAVRGLRETGLLSITIPWTEEPVHGTGTEDPYSSWGRKRVIYDLATENKKLQQALLCTKMHLCIVLA